jgi:hypothetical protein
VLAARLAGVVLFGLALPRMVWLLSSITLLLRQHGVEAIGVTGYLGGLVRTFWEFGAGVLESSALSGAMFAAGLFLIRARGPAFWRLLRRFPA